MWDTYTLNVRYYHLMGKLMIKYDQTHRRRWDHLLLPPPRELNAVQMMPDKCGNPGMLRGCTSPVYKPSDWSLIEIGPSFSL